MVEQVQLEPGSENEEMPLKARNPPPEPLPPGWILKEARSQPNCYYYYHQETGLSSWDPPAAEETPLVSDQADAPRQSKGATSTGDRKRKIASTESSTRPSAPESSKSKKKKSSAKEVRALHILKKHAGSRRPASWRNPNITATLEEAREELSGLVEILQESAADPEELRATFEELARTESDCSSAKRGGDLGFFGRKKMQPDFELASFALNIGEMSGIVETSSGVHVILRIG
jgi:NIMA-interacting peptidyl-prolyl cis-trans isomerase 1